MAKILNDPKSSSFYSPLTTLIVNTIPMDSLLQKSHNCQDTCAIFELTKQLKSFEYADLNYLISILDPENSENPINFLVYLFWYAHSHCEHSGLECPSSCCYHSGAFFTGSYDFACFAGHSTVESIPNTQFYFTVDGFKLFKQCPELVKEARDAQESLVCCYVDRIVSNFVADDSFICSVENCQSAAVKRYWVNALPRSLIFYVDYNRVPNLIEILRVIAGFPNNFSSSELFQNFESTNYTIVGYLLNSKDNKYGVLIYSESSDKWVFSSEGQQSTKSKYESILQLIIDNYKVLMVFYNQTKNKHKDCELKDTMWLNLENKIIKNLGVSEKGYANIKSPFQDKYWTCGKCKTVVFSSQACTCGNDFDISYLGWKCLCLRKNFDTTCQCHNTLNLCINCSKSYCVSKPNSLKLCKSCIDWTCEICKGKNTYPNAICLKCSNPSSAAFNDFQYLKLP